MLDLQHAPSTQEYDSLHKFIDQQTQGRFKFNTKISYLLLLLITSFIYLWYSILESTTTDYSINDNLHHHEKVLELLFKYVWWERLDRSASILNNIHHCDKNWPIKWLLFQANNLQRLIHKSWYLWEQGPPTNYWWKVYSTQNLIETI